MTEFFNSILDTIDTWISDLLGLLPASPFRLSAMPAGVIKILGYVNYYLPIAEMVYILSAWIACVTLYYAYSIGLRWIKAVD